MGGGGMELQDYACSLEQRVAMLEQNMEFMEFTHQEQLCALQRRIENAEERLAAIECPDGDAAAAANTDKMLMAAVATITAAVATIQPFVYASSDSSSASSSIVMCASVFVCISSIMLFVRVSDRCISSVLDNAASK